MTVLLTIDTVKNLVNQADAEPESTLAYEARAILAGWLKEPGLVMDAATRDLIHKTLARWGKEA